MHLNIDYVGEVCECTSIIVNFQLYKYTRYQTPLNFHYFSRKVCSEFLESMYYCKEILNCAIYSKFNIGCS